MIRSFLISIFLLAGYSLHGQFAPPAEQDGSTAIAADSSILINWVRQCSIFRGFKDIAQPDSGLVSLGDSSAVIGPALENGVVSLGDGGMALCLFDPPIRNGAGPDFAVFENAFDDAFLELAFVEVSSDGERFVRFPARSLTDTIEQTGPFGLTDARSVNNLAGKYRIGFGVPFDLEVLKDSISLDLDAIRYVRIIDVVGSLQPAFARRDAKGHPINDPYPTPFPSGGFDLDAIGVIHQAAPTATPLPDKQATILLFPNPLSKNTQLWLKGQLYPVHVQIFNLSGQLVFQQRCPAQLCSLSLPTLAKGVYLLKGTTEKGTFSRMIHIL